MNNSETTLSFDLNRPNPLLMVISGPSGVGKDAVVNGLKDRQLPFHFVVTMNSRAPRPGEVDGVDYLFVSREKFREMIEQGKMFEYAHVYDDYKGIPRSQIEDALNSGQDVLLRLDVQGARTVRASYPEAVLVFLIPENFDNWIKRFQGRGTETEASLRKRIEIAREELKCIPDFDYLVVNAQGQLDQAVDTVAQIIQIEKHRTRRLTLKE